MVATPIGNIEDITLRALRVLGEVDLIAAEDTRHTRKLLSAHGIATPLVSYHRHRERRRTGELVRRLLAGEHVALVADAGTPGINDPGGVLVEAAREAGITVVPVPGPSSLAAALSVAGGLTAAGDIHFCGFPPARPGRRRNFFAARRSWEGVLLFFEAPHRIRDSLADCLAVFGDCQAVLCRELTKVHEEVVADRLERIAERLTTGAIPARGEFVVLLELVPSPPDEDRLRAELADLLGQEGVSLRDAAARVAARHGLSRSRIYRLALALSTGRDVKNP